MKHKIKKIIITVAVGLTFNLTAVTTQVNIDYGSAEPVKLKSENVEQAFYTGELFNNAIPSTPAIGQAVKIIDTKDDIDYVVQIFKLKNKGIVYEIRHFLRNTIDAEGGKISSAINKETGEELLIVTAPMFQMPFISNAIEALDVEGTSFGATGSKKIVYETNNRPGSEMQDFIRLIGSKYKDLVIDDKIGKIFISDTPEMYQKITNYIGKFDVPAKMVRIECEIVEIEASDDFNFGLALEAWKNALPENVDMQFDWNQSSKEVSASPDSWARVAAQSIKMSGMRPKAAANIVNYLLRTGKAKILSRPSVVAVSGQSAMISSLDNIDYTAYSSPTETLDKKAQTGVALKIVPYVGKETIQLSISAEVSSIVGWSSGGTPIINNRITTADAVVKDGELFTLSGLRKDTIAKEDERVPILGSIPLIGYFFRHEIDVKRSTEIVVFLTPKAVTASSNIEEREREIIQKAREDADDSKDEKQINKFWDRVIMNKSSFWNEGH